MNPWMNTNEATNNMHREEQDTAHKAAIGKLTEMVREAQKSTLSELKAENAALKEQVAQLELIKDEHDERGIDIDILVQNLNSVEAKLTTLQSKSAALVDALTFISEIENRYDCGDWDEISQARGVANTALAAFKEEKK